MAILFGLSLAQFNCSLESGHDVGRTEMGNFTMSRTVCSGGLSICDTCASFVPRNKYGMMTQVTQTLKLEDTPKINSRFFGEGETSCPS